MQFATPFALLGLLLAIPLVALFFLKHRPRRQVVATTRFWQQALPDTRPRRWSQRLRDPLLLLLQLLILSLLVFALCEPHWTGELQQSVQRVLVIDASASMRATDVLPSRWDAALSHARQVIDALRPQDQLAILRAGPVPSVICGLTAHRPTLRESLARLAPTDAPARLATAIELAQRLVPPTREAELLVVTDPAGYARTQSELPAALGRRVRWQTLGQTVPNTGVTRIQVRRAVSDPIEFEILLQLIHAARRPLETELRVHLDDELLDVIPLQLEPQATWQRTLKYASPAGGVIRVSLASDDALDCDNQAWALLPPRLGRKVILATPGSLFLQGVLRSLPAVQLTVVDQVPAKLPEQAILVVHRLPLDQWPSQPTLLVDVTTNSQCLPVGELLNEPWVATQQSSPLMAHVQLLDLAAPGARQLNLPSDSQILAATAEGQPIYARLAHARGWALVLNLSLEQGELAWRTAFPLLISNAIQALAGAAGESLPAVVAGDSVTYDVGPTAVTGEWVSPQGDRRLLQLEAGTRQFGPLDRVGLWQWVPRPVGIPTTPPQRVTHATSGTPSFAQFACNLANADESNLLSGRSLVQSFTVAGGGRYPLWFVATCLAALVLAAEWWLYQRRWVG